MLTQLENTEWAEGLKNACTVLLKPPLDIKMTTDQLWSGVV